MKNETLLSGKLKQHQIIFSLRSAFLLGLAVTAVYAIFHGGLHPGSAAKALLLWGDGITISGVLLLLLTGAFFLDRKGIWDFLAYALYQARYLIFRKDLGEEPLTSFSDFRALRHRSTKPLWPWLSVGLIFLALGIILAVIYVA